MHESNSVHAFKENVSMRGVIAKKGKAEDSGLKGPGFNPWPRQVKVKTYFLLFLDGFFGTNEICL